MTRYLLDTETLSDLYDIGASGHPNITTRLAALAPEDRLFISILSLFELEYGHANAPSVMKLPIRSQIEKIKEDFETLHLPMQAAQIFGVLKVELREKRKLSSRGIRAHTVDLILAACAIASDCTLVSSDSIFVELRRARPDFKSADWKVP